MCLKRRYFDLRLVKLPIMTAARTRAMTMNTETQQSNRGTPATMYSTADTNTVP